METQKEVTIEDLQVENGLLRDENRQLNQTMIGLVTKNQQLAEFIRLKLTDILALAKEFRDEYGIYAKFVEQNTKIDPTGEIINDNGDPKKTDI